MLSVVMIVKNEASQLKDCLCSVAFADEIIVLDSGSTDHTVQIAEQQGAKVFTHNSWPGFGKQRQLAQSYAKGDWILMLDADERVTPVLAAAIQQAVKNSPCAYQLVRQSYCFGQPVHYGGWSGDKVVRLYPRDLIYSDDQVHESVQVPAAMPVLCLSGELQHFTYRDLHHYLTKSAYYADAWAQQRHQADKRVHLSQATTHALVSFIRMYIVRGGFLDGRLGFLLAALSAHSTFCKYAALWVLQRS